MQIFSAEKIFTGYDWLKGHVIVISNGNVESIIPNTQIGSDTEVKNFNDCLIVPAFIDVQVYGAGKKLFAVYPEVETLRLMYEKFSREGTSLFLPTLATNTIDVFKKGIDAVKQYWNKGGKGVYGLHLEGPWLNEIKRGAHVKEWIHSPMLMSLSII